MCYENVANLLLSRVKEGDDVPSMKNPVRPRGLAGFSLLEILVVVAVVAIMMALMLPAVSGFSSTAGRRGAVNILMNTFEQARIAAIESGQMVYVGFADADFPVEDMRYAAFVVFRDATDEEKAANPSRNYVVLKKWTRLPKNISLKSDVGNSLISIASTKTFDSKLLNELGSAQTDTKFPALAFNSTGTVEEPSGNSLFLFLYDGYFGNNRDNVTRNNADGSAPALFEKISLSRYTGRAQLDITATGS